ncbi:type VII secretion target [Amycolatopsis minnesotensis]|uniref:Excreted virulence factor EspC (Type VII ESX diderm) n=1 Tax=Amycolatopsis minnesotensis TaxID=337894 RepID=A0ABN2SLL4_9PSEU
MTAPSRFQVDPEEIRAHARTVGDVAAQLSSLAGGQRGGGPDGNALGSFVQFLTAGLRSTMDRVTRSVEHGAAAVDEMSTKLTRAAERYERTDEDGGTQLLGTERR